jgi:hypothetical protein
MTRVRLFPVFAIAVGTTILSGCASSSNPEPSVPLSSFAAVGSHAPTSTTVSGARSAVRALAVVSLADVATVRAPSQWQVSPFVGQPAPVYSPLDFISTASLITKCSSGSSGSECRTAHSWFEPDWTAPTDGVIVQWSEEQIPGSTLDTVPGKPVTIGGRPAKVWAGTATTACPPGTATELDAYISRAPTGDHFEMKACFGPDASSQDTTSVHTMMNSLLVLTP